MGVGLISLATLFPLGPAPAPRGDPEQPGRPDLRVGRRRHGRPGPALQAVVPPDLVLDRVGRTRSPATRSSRTRVADHRPPASSPRSRTLAGQQRRASAAACRSATTRSGGRSPASSPTPACYDPTPRLPGGLRHRRPTRPGSAPGSSAATARPYIRGRPRRRDRPAPTGSSGSPTSSPGAAHRADPAVSVHLPQPRLGLSAGQPAGRRGRRHLHLDRRHRLQPDRRRRPERRPARSCPTCRPATCPQADYRYTWFFTGRQLDAGATAPCSTATSSSATAARSASTRSPASAAQRPGRRDRRRGDLRLHRRANSSTRPATGFATGSDRTVLLRWPTTHARPRGPGRRLDLRRDLRARTSPTFDTAVDQHRRSRRSPAATGTRSPSGPTRRPTRDSSPRPAITVRWS